MAEFLVFCVFLVSWFFYEMWRQVGFWRSVFVAFFFLAVTLDMDTAILGTQNLAYGRPGPSTLAPSGHFEPGETLGDHGSSRKDMCGSGTRLLMILGRFRDPILKAFRVQMGYVLCFCPGLSPGFFLHRFVNRNPDS